MSDFQRYLRAKRTVDDRALDRRLLVELRERLAGRERLRVLEIGAGVGTMLTRFVEWEVLPVGEIEYTAVDVDAENAEAFREHLEEWAADREASVDADGSLVTPDRRVAVETVVGDGVAYAERRAGEFDLVVGAALLDILDADDVECLVGALAPGGLYYFPITFDGATRFRPSHPADRAVEHRYHEHMDRKPGGSSRAGGDTLVRLRAAPGELLGVAGSDWVVRPVGDGYPGNEAFFLRYILDTVEDALDDIGPPEGFPAWLSRRRAQVDAAELCYHTHQLDFLGHVPDESG